MLPRSLVEEREEEDPRYGLLGLPYGAPGPGYGRVTDVDVPLNGEGQRQPDGGRVEGLRHDVEHGLVSVAGLLGGDGLVVAEGVDVKVPAMYGWRLVFPCVQQVVWTWQT